MEIAVFVAGVFTGIIVTIVLHCVQQVVMMIEHITL